MDGAPPAIVPTVFIVDDDASVRDSLLGLMRSVDLAARAFASVQAFVDAGLCGEPGCLILDVRLPGRSGLEFQRELARDGHERPIVFITGHGDIPMSVAAMKAGAVEFLAKPFRDQDLLDAVHRALAIDAARRADAAARAVLAERADRRPPRPQRDHREGAPRPGDAQDAGGHPAGPRAHRGPAGGGSPVLIRPVLIRPVLF